MKLGLGTVQFGLDYGVSNEQGMTPPAAVQEILALAWRSGITLLDTAAAYGMSESAIGQGTPAGFSFAIVTKTPPFRKKRVGKAEAANLRETFQRSLERLKRPAAYGLLVHHADDLLVPGGGWLWQAMEALRAEGRVRKIGFSVYSPGEIERLLKAYRPDLIQLPVSVFDQRLVLGGWLPRLKELGIEIHSRSVFLQGLLLMPPEKLPPYFAPVKPLLERYRRALADRRISPLAAALGFVGRQPEIDCVIVGVNHPGHLAEIVQAARDGGALDGFDFSTFAVSDEAIVNPSSWRLP